MECVSGAKERAGQVEERLVREERVLEEREEAYGKLLVQLGQDTAISQEHGRLVARQRERVSHLKEVGTYCTYKCSRTHMYNTGGVCGYQVVFVVIK